jgi:hypothetical protein
VDVRQLFLGVEMDVLTVLLNGVILLALELGVFLMLVLKALI